MSEKLKACEKQPDIKRILKVGPTRATPRDVQTLMGQKLQEAMQRKTSK